MKNIFLAGILLAPLCLANAQEASPTPAAATAPTAGEEQEAATDPAALAPALREEVNQLFKDRFVAFRTVMEVL